MQYTSDAFQYLGIMIGLAGIGQQGADELGNGDDGVNGQCWLGIVVVVVLVVVAVIVVVILVVVVVVVIVVGSLLVVVVVVVEGMKTISRHVTETKIIGRSQPPRLPCSYVAAQEIVCTRRSLRFLEPEE